MAKEKEKFLLNFTLGTMIQFMGILCITLFIWFSSVGSTYKAASYSLVDDDKFLEVNNYSSVYFFSSKIAQVGLAIFLAFLFSLFLSEEKKGKKYEEYIDLLKKITLIFLTVLFLSSHFMRIIGVSVVEKQIITFDLIQWEGYVVGASWVIIVAYMSIIILLNYLYDDKKFK